MGQATFSHHAFTFSFGIHISIRSIAVNYLITGMYEGCADVEQTGLGRFSQFQHIARALYVCAEGSFLSREEICDCRCMHNVINTLCKLVEFIAVETKPALSDVTLQAGDIGGAEKGSVS